MKYPRLFSALLFSAFAATAAAAGLESFVGQAPSKLLQKEKPFAKAYRATIKGQDLPAWTNRLSVGFPAEAVTIDGKTLLLMSACNPDTGCHDERLYILYEPADQSITGFFFLPPAIDTPGDHRMAFSRWLGKLPSKERNDFLMARALQDANNPDKDPARLPMAKPAPTY